MEIKFDPVIRDISRNSSRNTDHLVFYFLVPALKESFATHAKGNLVDIGCGYRPYEFLLRPYITAYTGVDFSQNSAQSVDIIADATSIPLPDNSFDTCLSTQVLEHVKEPAAMIREAYRLLKPGGRFILSVPLYWPVHGEPWDYYRFTSYGIKDLLENAGFNLLSLTEIGGSWATAGQALANAFTFSDKRSFYFRTIRFLYYRLGMIRLINRLFRWMDKKDFNKEGTMNYVIVAEKK